MLVILFSVALSQNAAFKTYKEGHVEMSLFPLAR